MMWFFLTVVALCVTVIVAQIVHYKMNPEASANGKRIASSVPDWDATAKLPGDIPGDGFADTYR